jgi:hypothetical protein
MKIKGKKEMILKKEIILSSECIHCSCLCILVVIDQKKS